MIKFAIHCPPRQLFVPMGKIVITKIRHVLHVLLDKLFVKRPIYAARPDIIAIMVHAPNAVKDRQLVAIRAANQHKSVEKIVWVTRNVLSAIMIYVLTHKLVVLMVNLACPWVDVATRLNYTTAEISVVITRCAEINVVQVASSVTVINVVFNAGT